MKYAAKQLKLSLIKNYEDILADFKVNKYDRNYQIWKREPLGIELITASVFNQKLEYIHYNPVRPGFVKERKITIIRQQNFIMMEQIVLEC